MDWAHVVLAGLLAAHVIFWVLMTRQMWRLLGDLSSALTRIETLISRRW